MTYTREHPRACPGRVIPPTWMASAHTLTGLPFQCGANNVVLMRMESLYYDVRLVEPRHSLGYVT